MDIAGKTIAGSLVVGGALGGLITAFTKAKDNNPKTGNAIMYAGVGALIGIAFGYFLSSMLPSTPTDKEGFAV